MTSLGEGIACWVTRRDHEIAVLAAPARLSDGLVEALPGASGRQDLQQGLHLAVRTWRCQGIPG